MVRKHIISLSLRLSVVLLLLYTSSAAHGQQFWELLPGKTAPSEEERMLTPTHYQLFSLNGKELTSFLNQAGTQPQEAVIISLPTPSGKAMDFRIWKTPVLPPSLQERYPEIQTFTAESVTNPYISAKIDYTTQGFHAMVFQPGQVWMIDPYSHAADGYYICFYQADAPSSSGHTICLQEQHDRTTITPTGEPVVVPSPHPPAYTTQYASANIKRTYRLALSCTGEYAAAVAGANPNKADVLSAMTTTINRVNGIYEREMDITLVFINQEEDLIYLDKDTDPFTANNNGNLLLGQNQDNTDQVVGSGAYDIGHIFSTGGGGIARLTGVCRSGEKAKGVTGLANPVGDAFAVDYVAHEMGHQFGATHTFNNCNGNEYWRTAYEPGGGSTIMSYAGICGPQNNLQGHSDDYFHAVSLIQLTDSLSNNGNNCPVTEHLTISLPSFSSIQQHYVIPAATPFELEGPTATTGNNADSLTYTWEQWDLGNLQLPETNSANFSSGPVFRSLYPKVNNPNRVFPDLEDLVNNNSPTPGERLPVVDRQMQFKLTVRNIKNGWGSFRISDEAVSIQFKNTGRPFKVTQPDATGLAFDNDAPIDVTWDVAGTTGIPVKCATVTIYLSTDGGYTYPYVLADSLPNNGTATVQLPHVFTQKGRIKVKGKGNIFFDISDHNFAIGEASGISGTTGNKTLTVSPNPATNTLRIQSLHTGKIQAQLYNLLGKAVWQGRFEGQETIDTKAFSRGVYLLQCFIEDTQQQISRKVLLR